jgi:DNA invertase Pin-like site-specific DNA recombinase
MRQGLNYLRVSSRRQVDKGFDEDGLSLPAQREACARYATEHGIAIVGEYIERGESARTADRPAFQAMLARIQHDRDVQLVVVHKVDRFARNLEDHVTVRALLRRLGVELVSVVEPLDDSPQGRLTEGIHALMAEFYSANLAAEIRKGMTQKAKQGGWPHQAPLGYRNVRKPVGGGWWPASSPTPTAPTTSWPRSSCTLPATAPWSGSPPSWRPGGCATAAAATTHPSRSASAASPSCWPTRPMSG